MVLAYLMNVTRYLFNLNFVNGVCRIINRDFTDQFERISQPSYLDDCRNIKGNNAQVKKFMSMSRGYNINFQRTFDNS
jgi:hypothetical protein